jgi:hypothetical protein
MVIDTVSITVISLPTMEKGIAVPKVGSDFTKKSVVG